MLKTLAPARVRDAAAVGICLHRAMAVATSLPRDPARHHVRVVELPTEAGAQAKALARIAAQLGVKGAPAAVTLPLGSYSLLQIERPPVEDGELVDAARWRIKGMLDYPVEEAVIQVFEAPQASERQRTPLLNVVAAPARAVRELTATVKKAGLRPVKVTIAELAIRDVVAGIDTGNEPVATVFLNARQGMIQVTWGGKLYLSRRVDYGLASVRPADPLATGIHMTLPLELRRTVDYFDSHFGVGRVRRVLAAPADDAFMKFMQETSEFTGLATQPLELPANIDTEPGKAADYGLPEAYLAISGALGARAPAVRQEAV